MDCNRDEDNSTPKPDEKNRKGAATYARVSSGEQVKHGYSLYAQSERLREEARRRGYTNIYEVVDAGESGTNFEREGLSKILRLASEGKIDAVFVTSLDRIGRDLIESLNYVRRLDELGVKIVVMSGGETDVTTEIGLMTLTIQFPSAELENKRRAKFSIVGKVQSFKQKHWNKPEPLGYRKKADGWIEKDLRWGPVIRDVFKLFLETKNYQAVARMVNRRHGEVSQKPLTGHQVKQIVSNPVYIGKPQCAGKVVIRELGKPAIIEDSGLIFVDLETFEKAQEIIRENRKNFHKKMTVLDQFMEEYGIEVVPYIPRIAVLCPRCGHPTVRNGTLIAWGVTVCNYLCKKCGRQLRVPTKKDMERIQGWLSKRESGNGHNQFNGNSRHGTRPTTIEEFFDEGSHDSRGVGEDG